MCLRFVFLLALRVPAWLRLSQRPSAWKDAEILPLPTEVMDLDAHRAQKHDRASAVIHEFGKHKVSTQRANDSA